MALKVLEINKNINKKIMIYSKILLIHKILFTNLKCRNKIFSHKIGIWDENLIIIFKIKNKIKFNNKNMRKSFISILLYFIFKI